jgi:sorbitol-specific phosphotransferase system component IIBC
MRNALLTIVVGIVVYIAASTLITTLITGTGTGDVLIQQLLPLSIAIGVVIAGLTMFVKTD